jgi:hypothetical protein
VLAAAIGLYVLYYFAFLLIVLNAWVIGGLLLQRGPGRSPARQPAQEEAVDHVSRFTFHVFPKGDLSPQGTYGWARSTFSISPWLLAQALVLALYLPWLPIAWRQATHPPVPPWRGLIPLQDVLLEAWTALTLGQSVQPGQVWPVLVVTGILFVLGLRPLSRESGNQAIRQSGNQASGELGNQEIRQAGNRAIKKSGNQQTDSPLQFSSLPVFQPSILPASSALLAAYTFGPLALIYLVSLAVPLYHVRYLFTYAPPFYILLASGLAWLARRARPLAALAALALLAGSAFSIRELHTNPRYAADDFRAAVRFIAARWRPGDALLVNAGYAYTGFWYYYNGPIAGRMRLTDFQLPAQPAAAAAEYPLLLQSGSIGGDPNLGWGDPDSDFYATDQAETAAALARVTEAFPRLWVLRIYDTVTDPDGFIRGWLAANTIPFEDQVFDGEAFMRVQGFMSSNQPAPPQATPIALEGGISLLGWQSASSAPAGGPLDAVLWWQADLPPEQRPDTPYAVSLKLWASPSRGEPGQAYPVAQQDEWPLGSLLFTSAWPAGRPVRHPMRLWLPADLSPGQYWLDVEMYAPSSVQPLDRRDGQGHIIPLGAVAVTPNQQ